MERSNVYDRATDSEREPMDLAIFHTVYLNGSYLSPKIDPKLVNHDPWSPITNGDSVLWSLF